MRSRFRPGRSPKRGRKTGHDRPPLEKGAFLKKAGGLIRVALVYPNTYRAGMSSLGFQTVYRLANETAFIACERVFLPDNHKSEKQIAIRSMESGLALDQFDLILFSVSFENDFTHLVRIIGEAGIPPRSSDRNHIHPLVAAGGIACFLNPEPIAPFMDLFLLGEAERLLPPFFERFREQTGKTAFLSGIEPAIAGAYVPALHPETHGLKIQVPFLTDLSQTTTASCIVSESTAFKDTFLVETLKGCPHGCRFCSAGFIYRPPRIYPADNIKTAMDQAKGKARHIGLVSSAIADHPAMEDICRYGLDQGFRLSFSSLRADRLSDTFIRAMADSGVRTATIAPEAGSERMRAIINKNITKTDILSAAQRLVAAGILNLRLYFIIGLPFETMADIQAIVDLALAVKAVFLEASRKNRKIGTITLSINPFIPKPATPFQWAAMEPPNRLKKKLDRVRQGLKKTANLTLHIESLRQARIHALLSRGDRRAAVLLEQAVKKGWPTVMRENRDYVHRVVHQTIDPKHPLAWDFIETGLKKEFLVREWQRAAKEKPSRPCPMTDCARCGICRIR